MTILDIFQKLDSGTSQFLLPRFTTDGYDLSAARAGLGEGEPIFGNFIVTEALAGNTGLHAELQLVALCSSPDGQVSATVTFDDTGGVAEDIVSWTAHGLKTGDLFRFTTTGTKPTNLTTGAIYYVIEVNANAFQIASSYENALDGTEINFGSDGSGTHTGFGIHNNLSQVVTFDFTGGAVEDLVSWVGHGLLPGTPIRFTTGDSGAMPTGLTEDQTYFVTNVATDYFQVAATLREAMAGTRVEFTSDGTAVLNASVYPAVVGTSGPIPKELLAAGTRVPVRLNFPVIMGSDGNHQVPIGRYLYGRVEYSIPGGGTINVTAGKFRVDLVPGAQGNQAYYPSGFSVSF